jgi:dTDP-D-glucose 4,6-dehydratase
VLERLVQRYPDCHFYNLDRMDYCASRNNLAALMDAPNHTFVKVRSGEAWYRQST